MTHTPDPHAAVVSILPNKTPQPLPFLAYSVNEPFAAVHTFAMAAAAPACRAPPSIPMAKGKHTIMLIRVV